MAIVKEVRTVLSFERDGDNALPCPLVLNHFVELLDNLKHISDGNELLMACSEVRGYMKALFFADVINSQEHSDMHQLYSEAQNEWYRTH